MVAHRAEFDQGFVQKSLDALESPDSYDVLEDWDPSKPWVCTKSDIEWPSKLRGDSLVQLAFGLGLGVASAHRAASDVDTMARCLTRAREVLREEVRQICDLIPRKDERGKYTVGEALDIEPKLKAMYDGSPRIRSLLNPAPRFRDGVSNLLEALFRRGMRPKVRVVAQVSFEQKDMAKEAGFFWDRRAARVVPNDAARGHRGASVPSRGEAPDGLLHRRTKDLIEDIPPGSPVLERLTLDLRYSTYIEAAKSLGYPVDGVVYDVLGKPKQKPLQATPVEKRKYTKPTKKEPAPRLYANQRDRDETAEEYGRRLLEAIAEAPDRFYQRQKIVRLAERAVRGAD